MDPDTALKEIRNYAEVILAAPDQVSSGLVMFAEHVTALDGWMSNGGYPPAAWRFGEVSGT